MTPHTLRQGTPEWAAHRAKHWNASDAPAVMGCSPYKTRSQLLHECHTGLCAEVDAATQRRFDDGHRFEALALPLAEAIVGEPLSPMTGTNGRLSASFDGITFDYSVAFEHKTVSALLRDAIDADDGTGHRLPLQYKVQMEHQLAVCGGERVLFMASRWAADGTMLEEYHCFYYPDLELRAQILAAWEQFERDLAAYTPPVVAPVAVAAPQESLPAVSVRLDGAVAVASNLDRFGERLKAFVAAIPKAPATDDDFATCDAACKVLEEAESRLKAAVDGALASIAPVEELRRVAGDLLELARSTRLANGKLVTRRKDEIKAGIVACARSAWADHLAGLEATIAPAKIGHLVTPDFILAAKNKRTLATLSDAVQTELARAKVQANQLAEAIGAKLALYRDIAAGFEFLFADLYTLLHKDGEAFELLVRARIAEHRQAQQRKAEEAAAAQASKLAEEERMRAERHATPSAPSYVSKLTEEELARAQQRALEDDRPLGGLNDMMAGRLPNPYLTPSVVPIRQRPEEPATLRLADVQARLGFALPALFITDVLGLPLKRDGASWRTSESGFAAICAALVRHVQKAAFRHVDVSQERAL